MATSGTITGTTSNQYISCRLLWTATPDEANNRSDVSVTLQVKKSTSSTADTSGTGYFCLKFDGGTYHYTKTGLDIRHDNVWRTVKTWDFGWITHNADGSRKIHMYLSNHDNYSGIPGTTYTDSHLDGYATLNTIAKPTYTITSSIGPNGGISTLGVKQVSGGTDYTYTFTSAGGYRVGDVLVDGVSVGAVTSYTFSNISADHTISATFTETEPTVVAFTVTSGPGGFIAGDAFHTIGTDAVFTIIPFDGYAIDDVLADGVSVGAVGTYTFPTVAVGHSIHATFVSTATPPENPDPPVVGVTVTQAHTVAATGLVAKVRYHVAYEGDVRWPALVKIYHGTVEQDLIYQGSVAPDTDIDLLHAVTEDDTVTVVIATDYPILNGAYTVDLYEASGDNTWTMLGYADNQLVGMTANNQLWSGPGEEFELRNAKLLSDPAQLTFGSLSVVGGAFTISETYNASTHPYRVSVSYTLLNRFGPTEPSPPLTFYASKPTSEWSSANYVKATGTAPNYDTGDSAYYGVTAVELYFAEGEYQEMAFLGRVDVPDVDGTSPPATKPWSFNWTGYQIDTTAWLVSNLTPPTQNYTSGVPASKMSVIDGRLYFWGNPAYPYRIWAGGNPGNRFSVSPGVGGGFVDVEPGTGTVVTDVLKFKTQQGASIVTALCDNPNSHREARFNLIETNISISQEQSVKSWSAEKVSGAAGCKSDRGAVAAADGLYAVSRYGLALTTLTMEYNSQLQIMYVSDPIAPVFLKQYGTQLKASILFEINGVLYMTFGAPDGSLDNVIFCYDIALKAWWTFTLDADKPVLNMIHVDFEGAREGIGIITENKVYLLPTTLGEHADTLPAHEVLIESGELSTVQPLQGMHHLSQLEFRFDHFIGELDITVIMIDQFGRRITTKKRIHHDTLQHQLSEHLRIDQVVESYKIVLQGRAKMRLTHFIAKLYPKPMRIGMTRGFDSQQASKSSTIRRTFNSYNDLKEAIIP